MNTSSGSTDAKGSIGLDVRNGDYRIDCRNNSFTWKFYGNNHYCKNFRFDQDDNADMGFENTDNLDINVSENFDLKYGTGTYTLTWTKGTGSIIFNGSSGTHTFTPDGQSLEDIVLNCAGATIELDGDFTTDSLSGSGGTLQSDTPGTERTITATNQGTANNCTFKDIHMNAANKVNAKSGGVNNGNTKGIIFTDTLSMNAIGF